MQINENKFVCYTNLLYLCGLRDNNNHNLNKKYMWIVEAQNDEGTKKLVASNDYEQIIEFITMFYRLTSAEADELKEYGQTLREDELLIISVIPYVIG